MQYRGVTILRKYFIKFRYFLNDCFPQTENPNYRNENMIPVTENLISRTQNLIPGTENLILGPKT